jgi:hypothetical protein
LRFRSEVRIPIRGVKNLLERIGSVAYDDLHPLWAGFLYQDSGSVVEHVIAIASTRKTGYEFRGAGIENHQARWTAAHNGEPVLPFIKRHRIVCLRTARRPCSDHLAGRPIDDGTVLRSGRFTKIRSRVIDASDRS